MKIVLLHSADAAEPPVDPVIEQIRDALVCAHHDVAVQTTHDDAVALATEIRSCAPDLVFNIAESFNGKSALESNVAALLNLLGCRYTGSSPSGLILAGDKALTKKLLQFHGVRTPEFAVTYRGALDWAGDLDFPMIVKPPQEDGSIGIEAHSLVRDVKGLLERIDALQSEFGQPVLVEEFVDGREFYVGVLGNENAEALPIMELDFSGLPADLPRIASWDVKWGDDSAGGGAAFSGTRSVFPRDLDEELANRMRHVATEAFHALRLRDYARIDLRVTANGDVYVIEVNPNCYLEREGEFARAAARCGLDHPALIERIVELAVARYAR
ncbi:MAG TPA: ATP-grasp domain-containing protein [Gemmatimonadaceae bacterium]|nr:ATP-grasp domain-containing protein [Gemmatimonadaceae bacterium]